MIVEAYKGFESDMTCRGFQYELGQTYKMDGHPLMCARGFHACIIPDRVFIFYPPDYHSYYRNEADNGYYGRPHVYAKVYMEDPEIIWGDFGSAKICANNIRIGEKLLTVGEICKKNNRIRSPCE